MKCTENHYEKENHANPDCHIGAALTLPVSPVDWCKTRSQEQAKASAIFQSTPCQSNGSEGVYAFLGPGTAFRTKEGP